MGKNILDFSFEERDADLLKRNKCDKYDVSIALACGVIAGLVDSFFVGMPGNSKLGNLTDKMADDLVIKFAKKLGWKPKNGKSEIAGAIGYLERKYKVNYDARYAKDVGMDFAMDASDHHLKSLGHSPDIVGLFFSILAQFTNVAGYVSNGEIILAKVDGEPMLVGKSFISKLFCGTANWFGHIMSDVAGSSGRRGHNSDNRGSGVGAPFFEFFQLLDFGSIKDGDETKTIAEFSTKLFEKGYDLRFFAAMKIPEILCNLLIKLCWALKKHFYEKFEVSYCLKSVLFSSFAPDSLRVMLLWGHGTLCVVDAADAFIRSDLNAVNFFLHINLPAWYKLYALSMRELCIRMKLNSIELEIERMDYFHEQLKQYFEELKKVDVEKWKKETSELKAFSDSIKNISDESKLSEILIDEIHLLGGTVPWGEGRDLDEFMNDPESVLVFE